MPNHLSMPYGQRLCSLLLALFLLLSASAKAETFDWSVGAYAGQYYDSEPAGFSQGRANYLDQYLVAVTGSKTVWRSQNWPLSLEIDAMLGQQSGLASLTEVAAIPVLRWSSFPWNALLQTDLRLGPIGVSYTSSISPLERGPTGQGSQWLSHLLIELAFSSPHQQSEEVFVRLHHRCAIYDTLNNYGANGEDFLVFGYRHRF